MSGSTLVLERAFYVGINIQQFLTGVLVCVGFFAIHFTRNSRSMTQRQKAFYSLYTAVILLCMVIAVFANGYIGQLMWIDHRDAPGGPFAYFIEETTLWTNVWGSAVDIFANIIGDGFLLYRCYIIWHRSRWIITFPALVYAASIVLSIFALVESALPANNSFFVFAQVSFTIPWIALSSALNVILTAMISFRILRFRHELLSLFNQDAVQLAEQSQYLDTYTSVIAILIESALPFSVIGLTTCVLVGKGNEIASAFLIIWGTVAGLSPILIILRIAIGTAWTHDTSELPTRSLAFAARTRFGPLSSDSDTPRELSHDEADVLALPSETTFATQASIAEGPKDEEKV